MGSHLNRITHHASFQGRTHQSGSLSLMRVKREKTGVAAATTGAADFKQWPMNRLRFSVTSLAVVTAPALKSLQSRACFKL